MKILRIAMTACLIAAGPASLAATLNVVGGELQGASGVDVGGVLFDVVILDGSCISLFDGCDDASDDFAFTSQSDAEDAAQALLDQVFIDDPILGNFDLNPASTRGCSDGLVCRTIIPYAIDSTNLVLAFARNGDTADTDGVVAPNQVRRDADSSDSTADTFALFSPTTLQGAVPEPGSIFLLALGVAAIGMGRRGGQCTACSETNGPHVR